MYDVIVAGAGPAGSTAAMTLSQQGCQVLLVDQDTFPRDKACGDAVSYKTLQLLYDMGFTFSLNELGAYDIHSFSFYYPNESDSRVTFAQTLGGTIRRRVLDYALYQFAIQSGAVFEQMTVTDSIVENSEVKGIRGRLPHTSREVERYAKIVIVANGSTSILRRKLAQAEISPRHRAIAIRGYAKAENSGSTDAKFFYQHAILPVFPTLHNPSRKSRE